MNLAVAVVAALALSLAVARSLHFDDGVVGLDWLLSV